MELITITSLIILAYAFGSIPFGLLIGRRVAQTDVRQVGSGNIGATNVGRILGKKWGLLTLLCDMGKAVIPLVLSFYLLPNTKGDRWLSLVALAAFLGHLYPVYLRFKGGKGVATAFGIFVILVPSAALFDVVFFVASLTISGYISVASLTAATALPFLVGFLSHSRPYTILAGIVTVFVWIKHRDNIQRLLAGNEKSWR